MKDGQFTKIIYAGLRQHPISFEFFQQYAVEIGNREYEMQHRSASPELTRIWSGGSFVGKEIGKTYVSMSIDAVLADPQERVPKSTINRWCKETRKPYDAFKAEMTAVKIDGIEKRLARERAKKRMEMAIKKEDERRQEIQERRAARLRYTHYRLSLNGVEVIERKSTSPTSTKYESLGKKEAFKLAIARHNKWLEHHHKIVQSLSKIYASLPDDPMFYAPPKVTAKILPDIRRGIITKNLFNGELSDGKRMFLRLFAQHFFRVKEPDRVIYRILLMRVRGSKTSEMAKRVGLHESRIYSIKQKQDRALSRYFRPLF